MLLNALAPIFLIILAGYLLKQQRLIPESVWPGIEKLTYYLFFPCLLIARLSASEFSGSAFWLASKIIVLALIVMTLLVIVYGRVTSAQWPSLSSIYQGSVRFNTYIGLACIDGLFGESGLVLAALCLAVYVPLVNALCVIFLSFNHTSQKLSVAAVTLAVFQNPLVLACLIGLGLSIGGVALPSLISITLGFLSELALPLGLLAVGAGIKLDALRDQTAELASATLAKLVLMPLLTALLCRWFEAPLLLSAVIIVIMALPAPPSSYILAKQLGGNAGLMSNIITLQTLVAMLTIPIWVELAGLAL